MDEVQGIKSNDLQLLHSTTNVNNKHSAINESSASETLHRSSSKSLLDASLKTASKSTIEPTLNSNIDVENWSPNDVIKWLEECNMHDLIGNAYSANFTLSLHKRHDDNR